MPTYLYGLILSRNASRVPTDVSGIGHAPVRVVRCGDLAALVSIVDAPASRQSLAAIADHDRAAGMVARHGVTALASRFGQTFSDDAALCAELSSFSSRLVSTLQRYDGYGEMRVLMRETSAPSPTGEPRARVASTDSPGRAYLESLRDAARPHAPTDFRTRFGELVLDERLDWRRDVLTISHLVRFQDEKEYRAAMHTHPALQNATVTGPHALYAFAEPA